MTEAEQRPYPMSVKIETTAKGIAQVSVHAYGDQDEQTYVRAVETYLHTLTLLREREIKVANDQNG